MDECGEVVRVIINGEESSHNTRSSVPSFFGGAHTFSKISRAVSTFPNQAAIMKGVCCKESCAFGSAPACVSWEGFPFQVILPMGRGGSKKVARRRIVRTDAPLLISSLAADVWPLRACAACAPCADGTVSTRSAHGVATWHTEIQRHRRARTRARTSTPPGAKARPRSCPPRWGPPPPAAAPTMRVVRAGRVCV